MKGKKSWRRKRTLSRFLEIRLIEDADVKYAWAAYKKGKLKDMGAPFDGDSLDAKAFKSAFETYVLANASAAWTVIATTEMGQMPIGFVLGGAAPLGAYMIIIGIVWFPWASCRNVVEGAVGFFRRISKEMHWMGFASDEHKTMYEVCCAHGVMRRVGTSTNLGMAVYEGKAD